MLCHIMSPCDKPLGPPPCVSRPGLMDCAPAWSSSVYWGTCAFEFPPGLLSVDGWVSKPDTDFCVNLYFSVVKASCFLKPLELLCEKAIGTGNRPMGAGEALRRVLECLGSGILMAGQSEYYPWYYIYQIWLDEWFIGWCWSVFNSCFNCVI